MLTKASAVNFVHLSDLGEYRLVGLDPGKRMMLTIVSHPDPTAAGDVPLGPKLPSKRLSQAEWKFWLRCQRRKRRARPAAPQTAQEHQTPTRRRTRQKTFKESREEREQQNEKRQREERERKRRRKRRQALATNRNSGQRAAKRREREFYISNNVRFEAERSSVPTPPPPEGGRSGKRSYSSHCLQGGKRAANSALRCPCCRETRALTASQATDASPA